MLDNSIIRVTFIRGVNVGQLDNPSCVYRRAVDNPSYV